MLISLEEALALEVAEETGRARAVESNLSESVRENGLPQEDTQGKDGLLLTHAPPKAKGYLFRILKISKQRYK